MSTRHSIAILCAALAGCTCGAPAAPSPRTAAEETPAHEPAADETPSAASAAPADEPARSRPARSSNAAERIARFEASPSDERARARGRDAHLRAGRRLARAGDHEGALRELSAGLELFPNDATLLCEAGLQAHRSGALDRAKQLLEHGARNATVPSTEGACLYNLGRVYEDTGDPRAAAEVYRASLEVRSNEVVRRRLDGLVIPEGDDDPSDEDTWGTDFTALEREEPFESLPAICAAVAADGCWDDHEHVVPPEPTPALRELTIYLIHSDDDLQDYGYLVVRTDRGWRVVERVTESDSTDSYGRLEASETVDAIRFEDGELILEITGGVDEPEGEAEAYWRCEGEHDDADARQACFEAATDDLPAPETWTHEHRYRVEDGVLVPS